MVGYGHGLPNGNLHAGHVHLLVQPLSDFLGRGGRKVYMTHTNHNVEEVAAGQMYDLLVYGHTHQQDIRRVGRTLIINRGEATDWITGAARVVILDLKDMSHTAEPLG